MAALLLRNGILFLSDRCWNGVCLADILELDPSLGHLLREARRVLCFDGLEFDFTPSFQLIVTHLDQTIELLVNTLFSLLALLVRSLDRLKEVAFELGFHLILSKFLLIWLYKIFGWPFFQLSPVFVYFRRLRIGLCSLNTRDRAWPLKYLGLPLGSYPYV